MRGTKRQKYETDARSWQELTQGRLCADEIRLEGAWRERTNTPMGDDRARCAALRASPRARNEAQLSARHLEPKQTTGKLTASEALGVAPTTPRRELEEAEGGGRTDGRRLNAG